MSTHLKFLRPFLIAIFLMWSSLCASSDVDVGFWVQVWKREAAWVKDLPREDQSVVIHLLLKRLTDKICDDMMLQAKNAGEARVVMKVFFDGVALLPELATHSPELKSSLEIFGDMSQRFATRQIKPSQLGIEMEKNDRRIDSALATVPSRYFNTVPVQYKTLLDRAKGAIVVTALKINGWQPNEE